MWSVVSWNPTAPGVLRLPSGRLLRGRAISQGLPDRLCLHRQRHLLTRQVVPADKLPSRVAQLHFVVLLVTIPSTGWRGDVTQLLERAGLVIGQLCSAIAARRSGPCLPSTW